LNHERCRETWDRARDSDGLAGTQADPSAKRTARTEPERRLHPEEPAAGPWRVERIDDVIATFAHRAQRSTRQPLVVAIDGRSSSGKTTLGTRVAELIPATAIVHTDDIAWWHSRFGWTDLARHVLESVRSGASLVYRTPAWMDRGREGAIDRRNEGRGADNGWLAEELPWVAARRPWERADLIVDRTPMLASNRKTLCPPQ
jgi:hypothetical protein